MISTYYQDSKQPLLANNYWYLFELYRRGKFETTVDPARFEFYRPVPTETDEKKSPGTLKPAADDLYVLACDLAEAVIAREGQFTSESKAEIIELVWRSKVLSYEIDDYFLSISPAKSKLFVDLSKEISHDLPDYFQKHFGFVSDPQKQRSIVQYLLLGALCGINELYRKHDKKDYEEGVKRGEVILKYIKEELPRLPAPSGSGYGVSGLCFYIMGRLHFALGNYHDADCYFRESVEAYSEKIQKSRSEPFESMLATLRRCALASTFGSAYMALVEGKVRDAIDLSALARAILKHNSGKVYAAYAELIYLSAKRAQASSDGQTLRKVRRGLRQCRQIFKTYVNETHYVHRAGIQLGINYHYLAQAYPHLRKRYYQLATAYLEQAVIFAEAKSDERPHRNRRLLAEALTTLSHITSHSLADLNKADDQARRALVAAEGMPEYTCEAYLALGSIYYMQAVRSTTPQKVEAHAQDARWFVNQALANNHNANTRIRAAGYLRLAEINLLQPSTLPEVRHYHQKWEQVKELVEYEFLHRWGRKIKEAMQNINEHLFIDVRVSFSTKYWNRKVEEHLMYAAIRELANEPHGEQIEPTAGEKKLPGKDEKELKDKMRTEIRDYLMDKFKIRESHAYNKINEYKLIDKLREYRY